MSSHTPAAINLAGIPPTCVGAGLAPARRGVLPAPRPQGPCGPCCPPGPLCPRRNPVPGLATTTPPGCHALFVGEEHAPPVARLTRSLVLAPRLCAWIRATWHLAPGTWHPFTLAPRPQGPCRPCCPLGPLCPRPAARLPRFRAARSRWHQQHRRVAPSHHLLRNAAQEPPGHS